MPASFAPLVFLNGVPALHCPVTGRVVLGDEEGFDLAADQSRHLRFVIDWVGGIHLARPEDVPKDQAAYQQQVVDILGSEGDRYDDQNALVAACVAVMPPSAIV